jgi:Ribbon-helix-helix protein, copG family
MKKASKVKRHVGPSAASLRAIPELSDDAIDFGRGAEGLRRAKAYMRAAKLGRPKAGVKAEGSTPRSVRLPDAAWSALESTAKERGTTVHALLREAVAKFLKRAAA